MREMHSILVASGVPAQRRLRAPLPAARRPRSPASGSITPSWSREAGPCGQWPHDLGPSADGNYIENQPYWNLGCASQRNLAAMVDNPADLVQPRGETPAYDAAPVGRDRQIPQGRETRPAITHGYDKGKISDLGK